MVSSFSKEGSRSSKDSGSNSYFSSPSAVSLPKGGGAIRGIGEKFSINPVTGTGALSLPIFTSPSRSDFHPKLSLNYDSGAGNGSFGLGWNLSVPSIARKTDKGLPKYQDSEDSDIFILSGAEDLIPSLVTSGEDWIKDIATETPENRAYKVQRYRPRIEGLFARIERWQHQETGDIHWRSISKDNVTSIYGETKDFNSRIADPEYPSRVFKWLLEASYDDRGNLIVYEYKQEDSKQVPQDAVSDKNRLLVPQANVYLKRIKYGNRTPYKQGDGQPGGDIVTLANSNDWLFQVVFDYGEHDPTNPTPTGEPNPWGYRSDAFSNYRAGFEIRTRRLCQRVLMFHRFDESGTIGANWNLVRSTNFDYDPDPVATYLISTTQIGYSQGAPEGKSYPSLEFRYDRPTINNQISSIDPNSLKNLPIGLDGSKYQWIDLDSEGISGILTEQATGWLYKRNLGEAQFGTTELVATKPSIANLRNSQQRLMDLAGDGTLDLVSLGKLSGYYERQKSGEWQPFVTFEFSPTVNWNDPNLRFIDVTGDGHADILISERELFVWYPSKAREGFGAAVRVYKLQDEEKGPTLVFADVLQSVFLSDMTGDGLIDIVRIRNGEVCYWPNLGYGRFGAKVTLDGSPLFAHPEVFDPKRIRLADIDGSGTTDIIYLGRGEFQVWFNQAGNSLRKHGSRPGEQPLTFPAVDNLASVQAIDLFGNGTACIVWSSSLPGDGQQPMYYIDLMGGQKPHLLRSLVNNMGAETKLQYAASTKFYLQDRAAGTPWITRLPFPVHVVERVETLDRITGNRFVTTYRYRHGFFDGEEREFRGFAYVEQKDTEQYEKFQQGGGTNASAAGLHLPPVVTKTWFHTGAYFEREAIEKQLKREYYASDPQAVFLPDTILPKDLTPQEQREACRALKGQMLRQEIYAEDESDKSQHPYRVTESNYEIRRVQPLGQQRYAVFFTHPRETITYHYERHPADPRVAHQMTLEVDDFGNVLKSVAIAYPRRSIPTPASDSPSEEQAQILITYTENQVANVPDRPDWYRIGVPVETSTYEITGVKPNNGKLFSLTDFYKKPENSGQPSGYYNASEISYEARPTPNTPQKRLIERVRTLYRRNSQANTTDPVPLDLSKIDSLALPCESFKQAFTPGLLTLVYDSKIGSNALDDLLREEGKYVQLRDSDAWWIPSGRQAFDPARFYLPVRTKDPFGQEYVSTYDRHALLVVETVDPLENRIQLRNNYRVMQPAQLTDANGNRSEVVFNALGMVVGTAVMGKVGETKGDSLEGFEPDLDEGKLRRHIENPLANPEEILGKATTRLIYDLEAYRRTQQPVVVYTLARETHNSDLPAAGQSKIQHSFLYSDGFGREAQSKIQAEPGPLDPNIPNSPTINPRWVGTGTKIYNNKGKIARQYEPFFSPTHQFGIEQHGVSDTLFYDPIERLVATLHPNHTYEKVVFDAWQQATWDVNDTVAVDPSIDEDTKHFLLAPDGTPRLPKEDYSPTWYEQRRGGQMGQQEKDAAQKAASHANTPTIAHLDVLGRTVLTIADNGGGQKFPTRIELDIEGNQRSVTDAKGRKVMVYDYDMLGNVIHQRSMEAGDRWMLNNVAGNPIRQWDSRNYQIRTRYDALQRPTHVFMQQGEAAELLVERLVYGESNLDASRNLRGKLYRHYDQAGVATNERFDFKGNLLESSRQLAKEYKQTVNWLVLADLEDLQRLINVANSSLETEIFTSLTRYDAMNRPVMLVTPHNRTTRPNIIQPSYNEANLLEKIDVWLRRNAVPAELLAANTTDFHPVTNIDYNAKGQRLAIEYGNGTTTRYFYDGETFRLIRLLTMRSQLGENENQNVQDLRYSYDPVGNITYIQDNSDLQNVIYFRNQRVEPSASYEYDPLYRLIKATGREHLGQTGGRLNAPQQTDSDDTPRMNLPHPNDGNAMGTYTEEYKYDEVGNILRMVHQALNGGWTRHYDYSEPSLIETDKVSNRLSRTSLPGDAEGEFGARYKYDEHGNMTRMPHLPSMQWDYRDQLQASARQVRNDGGAAETTYYVYDASGQRVRKVTERQGQNPTRLKERIYLGGFEIYREYNGGGNAVTLERETLHVMDDQQRIAVVETRTRGNDRSLAQLVRYQIGNHLGSAALELDDGANVISYEEYYPYGGTSYQGVKSQTETSKRYRYTGKERDEENGLYYHGARYYAPWLGRWTASDPARMVDGTNLYLYVRNNPLMYADSTGAYCDPTTQSCVDPTEPTEREEALQQSLPENERHLPPASFEAHPPSPSAESPPAEPLPASSSTPLTEKSETGGKSVGKPGFGESLIPVWGSGREAIYNFQKGSWGWGILYTGLAVTDVFLVKSLATAAGKAIIKTVARETTELATKEVAEKGIEKVAETTFKEASEKTAQEVVEKTTKEAVSKEVTEVGLQSFTHAEKYGIKPYKELKKLLEGTKLEAHHLIEKRFAKILGISANKIESIALTKTEHQLFTNAWRQAIGYVGDTNIINTANVTKEQILNAARNIYKEYPYILQKLGL
ncbi:SpvB/TcaC N-terminal domain-containing protein [Pseudanabaena sp. PCC 6802]|uniref:SpvB/TcaC N-terminal domain-containing protein n=1 Tax=Pseudanabaena sp. PCC 6802 TaxID=118173 RepID=UPI000380B0F5|nr:SpvB/TcaC N-terminal domain-containing protein [Pseudanabaena sp. PCC 6802]